MGQSPHQGQINAMFLDSIDTQTRNEIIVSIANHYQTDTDTIIDELFDKDSHCLLEYMVSPKREATLLLMRVHGFK